MIRINLIAAERRTAKAGSRSLDIGKKVTIAGGLILVLTGGLVGWRYWTLVGEASTVRNDIAAAQREEARLAEVLKQVADFEAHRAQLQQRVELIDQLRKGQTAPVHLVDQISRALPDMLWLTSLKQDGYDVTIEGRCVSQTALSDFVGNLESSRYFKRPVEIISSAVLPRQQDGVELIGFVIKGSFQMAGIEPKPAPPAAKKPAPKAGKNG